MAIRSYFYTKAQRLYRIKGRALRALWRAEARLQSFLRQIKPGPLTLFSDVTAHWLGSALGFAASLRLADHLEPKQPQSVADLAEHVSIDKLCLLRLLRLLSAHGYFRLLDGGLRVAHTRLSLALRSDSVRAFAELQARLWYRQSFAPSHMETACEGGVSGFEAATGQHFFDHLEREPKDGLLFLESMADITRFCTPYLVECLPVTPSSRVLDVGGGDGELARALAAVLPDLVVGVVDRSKTDRSHENTSSEYRFHQGDFFRSVPGGYDHLLLKNILHDWNDERSLTILARCRDAVERGGRLTVIECLLPVPGQETAADAETFALDWNVWATLSGQERSAQEYEDLLNRSGWELERAQPTATPYWLLHAKAV